MPQILYVNPSPLKGKRTMAKKRRSAAQRAATKRMIAANRSRRAGRKAAPKRKASRRRNPVTPLRASNPRRKARRSPARAYKRRARRRSNPSMPGFVRDAMSALVPSAIGGAGALAVDVAMAVLPLPAMLTSPAIKPVARVGAAIAIGALVGMVANRRMGSQVMAGGLTVVMYDTIKGVAAKALGGKVPGIGVYDVPGIGMYEVQAAPMLPAPAQTGMGYAESAMQFEDGSVGEYVG